MFFFILNKLFHLYTSGGDIELDFSLQHTSDKSVEVLLLIKMLRQKFGYCDRAGWHHWLLSRLSRMWSTSASWSAATSSTVASTAARIPVTVETVSLAGSPVSPAVVFLQSNSLLFMGQVSVKKKKKLIYLLTSSLGLCSYPMWLPDSSLQVLTSWHVTVGSLSCIRPSHVAQSLQSAKTCAPEDTIVTTKVRQNSEYTRCI